MSDTHSAHCSRCCPVEPEPEPENEPVPLAAWVCGVLAAVVVVGSWAGLMWVATSVFRE